MGETKRTPFIMAEGVKELTAEMLRDDYLVPVFSRDNEETISNADFIDAVQNVATSFYGTNVDQQIVASHEMKMRNQNGLGKKKSELTPEDYGSYMQRVATMVEIPDVTVNIHGCEHHLQICGIRSYTDTNLLGSQNAEKFRIGVGFVNMICTNMCLSVEGVKMDLLARNTDEITAAFINLIKNYDMQKHMESLEMMENVKFSPEMVAQFVGKMRFASTLTPKQRENAGLPNLLITDTQMNAFCRDYMFDKNFGVLAADKNDCIDGWQLYNLLTNFKKNYIDLTMERNVNAFEIASGLVGAYEGTNNDWDYFKI